MLSSTDREFFALVSEAAFANPFSEERIHIDRRIARAPAKMDRGQLVERLLAAVQARLQGLDDGKLDLRRYPAEDRATLEHAVLFDLFHRYADPFDALIQRELTRGGSPQPVDFAKDALRALTHAGFDAAEARRYFAMFYQLRRAFYFIEHTLPGASRSMRELRQRLWSNVFTHDVRLYARSLWRKMEDFSTFLLGETGTGKGTAAAAIGRSGFIPFDEKGGVFSESFVEGFISINLSQFPESLIESELFGHKRGAFTGAVDNHTGVLERTSPHGAILLDEIGEIGVPVQIKLLRVLQERTFSPVGGHDSVRFQGRVIAATNRPLDELRAEGGFRDDFYYRLCSDVIRVPSLQQRLGEDRSELEVLLSFILRRILGEDAKEVRALVREAIDEGLGPSYAWPGNVRELEQCVRRVVLTRGYAGDALARSKTGDNEARLLAAVGAEESAKGLLARYCRALYARHGSYEEVARRTELDRRTVKRYVDAAE
jgi:DNA-binding NtrC family response regulator